MRTAEVATGDHRCGGRNALHGTYLGDGIAAGDFGTGVPGATLLFVAAFGFAYSGSPL